MPVHYAPKPARWRAPKHKILQVESARLGCTFPPRCGTKASTFVANTPSTVAVRKTALYERAVLPLSIARARRELALACALCCALFVGCSRSHRSSLDEDGASSEPALRVTMLNASRGTREQSVLLTFVAPTQRAPTGFIVLRDGQPIADLSADRRSFEDLTAQPGQLAAPQVEAGEPFAHGARIRWTASEPSPGPRHVYRVLAQFGDQVSAPSQPSEGYRGKPSSIRFEGCRAPCETWLDFGTADAYVDTSAPAARIVAGRVEAVANVVPSAAVSLTVRGTQVIPSSSQYQVRARSGDLVSPPSAPVLAERSAGPLSFHWQRAAKDDDSFVTLPEVTGESWIDSGAPFASALRYRVVVSGAGADSATSDAMAVSSAQPALQVSADESVCTLMHDETLRCTAPLAVDLEERQLREPERYESVVTRGRLVCALRKPDRRVRCWSGSAASSLTTEAFRALSGQGGAICGITQGGTSLCWTSQFERSAIVSDGTTRSYTRIAAKYAESCGIDGADGSLLCRISFDTSPPVLRSYPGPYSDLSMGEHNVCALRASDGRVECFQAGAPFLSSFALSTLSGTCGLERGTRLPICWDPETGEVERPSALPQRAIDAVGMRCMVDDDGRVACPGMAVPTISPDASTQVAGGPKPCIATKVGLACWTHKGLVSLTPEAVHGISQSTSAVCALDREDHGHCWSLDTLRELTLPAALGDRPLSALAMSYGDKTCAILRESQQLHCTGAGSPGNLSWPQGKNLRELVMTDYHACALDGDGYLFCFGKHGGAQVVEGPSDEPFDAIATNSNATCGVTKADQQIRCYTALQPPAYQYAPPAQVVGERFETLTLDEQRLCALRARDHKIVCWGGSSTPDGETVASYHGLSSRDGHTCAVRRSDERVVCWGPTLLGSAGQPLVTP